MIKYVNCGKIRWGPFYVRIVLKYTSPLSFFSSPVFVVAILRSKAGGNPKISGAQRNGRSFEEKGFSNGTVKMALAPRAPCSAGSEKR